MNNWRLFMRIWHGSAPLAVWAAHFTFCYVLVAAQCTLAGSQSVLSLWVATVLGVALCGAIFWRARAALRGDADLASQARAVAAVLAATAIAWNAVPLLFLDGCG